MSSQSTKPKQQKGKSSSDSGLMGLAEFLGKIAWIVLLIEAIIFVILAIYYLVVLAAVSAAAAEAGVYSYIAADLAFYTIYGWFYLIGAILAVIFAIAFVRPRFSKKWADKDYDYLLNDVIKIGSVRIPLFLIIGIILEIFLAWWGGLIILVPLLILIFAGPKEYKWKEE
ncbi:MAG: hypothetical protein EU551_04485 [Promethearchaeota archaeon]|nr:MAG: hypothetical protein EU551_04485 [Candidatus Lokiarchaeota archaeon]